jgi:8-oxo-dGTP diphosphatase
LELSLGSATRATSTVISKEEADNYWVTVYKGQEICREKTRLKDLETRLSAGYGYVVEAESCLEPEAESANNGWGQRRYTGQSASFAIKPGETTKVGVGCTVANAGVEVVFDETMAHHFTTSYSVTITEGERTIVFDKLTGGKREAGETGEAAAIREIKEELNLDIKIDDFLITIDYDYPTFHLTMDCYLASADVTEMHINERQAISWISSKDLDAARWLPADILVVEELKKRI